MRCSGCEAENRPGVRFCEKCGGPLVGRCTSCGEPMVVGARFCGQCGAALEHRLDAPGAARTHTVTLNDVARGEHKPVSALFCDIVDSTGTAERIGSEAMHRMLDRFFCIALEEVERYGGTIDKFLGDGFLALVGVPQAHEDHARRAVLAALALRRRLAEEWSETEAGPAPRIRMGINTGTVLIGTMGGERQSDYTAVGDTTNVAARLQSLAQPGEILASEATVRLVAGYAHLEEIGPVALRGRSSTVCVHRVLGVGPRRSPLDGVVPRSLTPFVGRDSQLAALLDVLARVREGHGQAVGIVAEPGMGKSRILLELRLSLAGERLTLLEGRCLSFGAATPYLPVLDIVRANCGITADDPPDAVRGKVTFALVEVDMDPERWAPFLLHLLGEAEGTESVGGLSPEAVRARTFETIRTMCLQGSWVRPIVLVVEDMHWVDPSSEALLLTLAGAWPAPRSCSSSPTGRAIGRPGRAARGPRRCRCFPWGLPRVGASCAW
jgi:class 3 adenylate cyclase